MRGKPAGQFGTHCAGQWLAGLALCLALAAIAPAAAADDTVASVTLQLDDQHQASARASASLGAAVGKPIILDIRGVQPARYRLTFSAGNNGAIPPPGVVPLYNAAVGGGAACENGYAVDCYLQGDPALLLVDAATSTAAIESVSITPLSTEEAALPSDAALASGPAPRQGALAAAIAAMLPGPETPATLAAFRTVSADEDVAVLDTALARIFPGKRPAAPERVAAAILGYCGQVIQLKATGVQCGSAVLSQGFAFCHGMALAYAALCRRAGLPARVNALYNFGLMQSHNMVEVYYDEGWHLYDPTYGTLFQDAPLHDAPQASLPLRALMAHAVTPVYVVQVDRRIGSGSFDPQYGWRALPPEAHYARWPFSLQTFYDTLFARAAPVLWSETATAVFPIDLDMRDASTAWAGAVDGSLEDQFGKQADRSYTRFAGAPVLGAMPVGRGLHLLRLRCAGKELGRVTLHLLPGATLQGLQIEALSGGRVTAARQDGHRLMVECSLDAAETWLLLVPGAGAAMVDAYEATCVSPAGTE